MEASSEILIIAEAFSERYAPLHRALARNTALTGDPFREIIALRMTEGSPKGITSHEENILHMRLPPNRLGLPPPQACAPRGPDASDGQGQLPWGSL